MATIHIVLTQVQERSIATGGVLPVADSVPIASDTLTSTGTSSQSSIVTANEHGVWCVTARDGDVWVKFGTNPTAVADDGWLVLMGQTRDFGVTTRAEKIAVKDA